MIASELGRELGIQPSVISKRLKLYYEVESIAAEQHLTEKTSNVMREAHKVFVSGRMKNFEQALLIVLGKSVAPMPAESVVAVERRLAGLEESHGELLEIARRLLQLVEGAVTGQVPTGAGMFLGISRPEVEFALEQLLPSGSDNHSTSTPAMHDVPASPSVVAGSDHNASMGRPSTPDVLPGQPTLLDWPAE